MSQNYLNYKLDGDFIGTHKTEYLNTVAELVYVWRAQDGFIDIKDPLNHSVDIHNEIEKVPEGKVLIVLVSNGPFDAALCLVDPIDFREWWEMQPYRETEGNDPRIYHYYLLGRDEALLMLSPEAKDFKYFEDKKEKA